MAINFHQFRKKQSLLFNGLAEYYKRSQTYLLTVEDSSLPVERFPIYIWVEPGQINPPGQYIDQIPIKVYEGSYSSGSIPTIVGRGTVSIQLKLSNQVQLAIGNRSFNRSGEFNIKFEELIKGKALVYDVHIDSNNAYDIHIESKYNGALKNTVDAIKTTIPYTMYIDDQQIQLNDFGKAIFHANKQMSDQITHKVKMILGDTSHAFKGNIVIELLWKPLQGINNSFEKKLQVWLSLGSLVPFLQ